MYRTVRLSTLGLIVGVVSVSPPVRAADIGTAFTYQGFLEKPAGTPVGTPAPVNCDFEFTLWDDPSSVLLINQIGVTQAVSGVGVSKGVFTVGAPDIDFGDGAFNGTARWLEIKVCCPNAPPCTPVLLAPRVELKPAPYALRAVQGVGPPGVLNVTPTGDVGIAGTLTLSAPGGGPGVALLATTGSTKSNTSEIFINTATNDTLYSLDVDASEVKLTLGPVGGTGGPVHATTISGSKSNSSEIIGNDTLYSLDVDAGEVKLTLGPVGGTGGPVHATTLNSSKSNSSEIIGNDKLYSLDVDSSETTLKLGWSGGGPGGTVLKTIGTTKSNTFRMIDSLGNTTVDISDTGASFKGAIKSGNSLIVDGPNDRLLTTSGVMSFGRDPATGSFANVNVGIGTTSPLSKLHLEFNEPTSDGITIKNTATGGGRFSLGSSANSSGIGGGKFFLVDQTSGLVRLVVNSTGDVGIGTTTPTELLFVKKDQNAVTRLHLENLTNGTAAFPIFESKNDAGRVLQLGITSSGYTTVNGIAANESVVQSNGSNVVMHTSGTGVLRFQTASAERMRIDASGNVGIGTTSPSNPLEMGSGAHVTAGGTWTNASSKELKENFADVNSRAVLDRVVDLPIRAWNYKNENDSVRHIGPVAEEFHEQFGLGGDDKSIGTIDADGVALAAIQGLYQIVQEKNCRIDELEAKAASVEQLEAKLAALEALVSKLAAQQNGGGR